jgi:DNA-binding beta-propeller fold protein YncE
MRFTSSFLALFLPLAFTCGADLPSDNVLFNGWGLTPAGAHEALIGDMALKMIVAPDGKIAVAVSAGYNNPGLSVIDIATRKVVKTLPLPHTWNGLCFDGEGKRLIVSGGPSGELHVFGYANGELTPQPSVKITREGSPLFIAGIAVHPLTGKFYLCNEANNEVCVLDERDFAVKQIIPVGEHPHSCVFGADKRHLYVSNWGGRSVTVVDTDKGRHIRNLSVGVRPNDMALSPDGRLFVACSGDNTVHVIQTRTLEKKGEDADSTRRLWDGTREIISTSLYPQSPEGSTPDAVAVSPDGKTLFIANADNNAVMVANIGGSLDEDDAKYAEKVSLVEGFIPVGWYPTALAVSPDNNTLLVASGKGISGIGNPSVASRPQSPEEKPKMIHPAKFLKGSVSFIAKPDDKQMAAYTQQVRANSPYTPDSMKRSALKNESVIPDKVGAPCPIKHVLYIIKENRTYDQVLGDLKNAEGQPIGNGDPSITMFGESITPNQHQIARDYVTLDNLYCNGEVSVDGHSWCDAAIATDFNQRSWTLSYSSRKDKLPGNDEMETPTAGYLWDLCRRGGVSFRNYGEGAQRVPSANRGKWSGARDPDRVENWIADLNKAEQEGGELPQFAIMSLGENHTFGTTPGKHTPEACVASNDLALGRIVAAATHSKFWKEMAIFVIEDDAQNGPDHVDAHRTIGFVISPYTKRKTVDSTLYTTASMIRTMELILGLPPLTQYDGGATPMFNSFAKVAQLTPYETKIPATDILATNSPSAPGAKKSAMMDFDEYDRCPEDELNRILWAATKGENVPYPAPIHRVLFTKE